MKKKLVVGLTSLAAVAAIGGTFAYFTTEHTFENQFKTTSFSGETVEKFNPGEAKQWAPGGVVDKKVSAKNTGDGNLWVRIKLEEEWSNVGLTDGVQGTKKLDNKEGKLETVDQKVPDDGLTAEDGTVVEKMFADGKKDNWTLGEDGYYYYNWALSKEDGEITLLNSVKLYEAADMGNFTEKTYVAIKTAPAKGQPANDEPVFDGNVSDTNFDVSTAEQGKWYVLNGELPDTLKGYDVWTKHVKTPGTNNGYAGANYTLTITSELIQADETAAKGYEDTNKNWVVIPNTLTKSEAEAAASVEPQA